MTDAEKQAEKLLPCDKVTRLCDSRYEEECYGCWHRPGVAAALAEKDAEIERLKKIITVIMGRCAYLLDDDQFNNLQALAEIEPTFDAIVEEKETEIENLRAALQAAEQMNQKLWESLTPEKRHELNLAEGKK